MEDADISRDDAMVASVSMTGNIQLSRLMSPRRERQIVPIKKARLIALSPTSDIIAAGLVDGEIQIFNVVTGRSLALLGENLFKIRLLSFSPNGRWLLEGSKAGLRAWDASRLTELLPEATFHNKLVEAASMSPDDNTTVAFIENTGDIHVSTNSFGGPALKRKVGTLSYDPYLKSKYDVVMTAGGSSVAIAWTSDATRMPIYKFGSYDSPGTYRIDPTSTDEDDAPGSTTS
ncbi:hypothetical protein FRB99_000241 [Tulasnella sp. 403]|nr:hypothetical protein FRB99_000241 [Tulasnella sp. 403]